VAAHVGHAAIPPVAGSIDLDWSDDALADLDRFAAFLQEQSPELAAIVAEEIVFSASCAGFHGFGFFVFCDCKTSAPGFKSERRLQFPSQIRVALLRDAQSANHLLFDSLPLDGRHTAQHAINMAQWLHANNR
jgi:hypothetical protein